MFYSKKNILVFLEMASPRETGTVPIVSAHFQALHPTRCKIVSVISKAHIPDATTRDEHEKNESQVLIAAYDVRPVQGACLIL